MTIGKSFASALTATAILTSAIGLAAQAQQPQKSTQRNADLIHRYEFKGNLNDSVGTINGSPTEVGTYLEAPDYSRDIPSGVVRRGPLKSIEFGMNLGAKKSGFVLHQDVISLTTGSYIFWMKADSMAFGRYVFAPVPIVDGPFLFSANADTIQVTAGDDKTSIKRDSFTTNQWHHIAVTWDNPAGSLSFYFDGSLVSTETFDPANSIQPNTVRVGGFSMVDDSDHLANQYDGHLYDIQLYSGQLSAGDVATLYANPGMAGAGS